MSRKKTTIQDLLFFIRNGVVDCKDYFIPLNAISYVRLKTQRGTPVLSVEINTGHTFLLRHNNLEFLSDLMSIIKANRFNTSAYYQVDVMKGTIFCTNLGDLSEISANIPVDTAVLPPPETIAETEPPKDVSSHKPTRPTAAAAFRSHAKRPSSISSKGIHMAEERKPAKPSVPPALPKAGSGIGLTDTSSIGCGFTAAELYAHKKKEKPQTSDPTTDGTAPPFSQINITEPANSAISQYAQPKHSATLLPETQPKPRPSAKKKRPPKTVSAPPQAPSVQAPVRKKTLPKYYSASEFLRNHGQLSTTSDGPVAPYEEILENQRKNDHLE